MAITQIADGLWRWTARHPDWSPDKSGVGGWEHEVASHYLETDDAAVAIDPLIPNDSGAHDVWNVLDAGARRHCLDIVITIHWHGRSTDFLRSRYSAAAGVRVWAPDDPDIHQRLGTPVDRTYGDGDQLPGGMVALVLDRESHHDALVYLPEQRAVIAGDGLVGVDDGIRVWWTQHSEEEQQRYRDEIVPELHRLLEAPLEMVLPSHGEPVLAGGAVALAGALQGPVWQRPD